MANTKKVTKREMFAKVREIVEQANPTNKDEILAFVDHEVELLTKKSTSKTPTKTQKANESYKTLVTDCLAKADKPMTVSMLMAEYGEVLVDSEDVALSNQKLSSLLKALKDANKVVRTEDKKKAYFTLA